MEHLPAKQKLPPLVIVRATIALRNFLIRLANRMLPSSYVLLEQAAQFWKAKSIAVAAQLDISGMLVQGPESSAKLAEKAGVHPESLNRMLRALASDGIFREVRPGVFGNTRLSEALIKGSPSVRSFILHHLGQNNWELVNDLPECIRTGGNAIEPRYGMDPFTFLAKNPDNNDVFNQAMTDTILLAGDIMARSYPFCRYPTIADLGGGEGLFLSIVLRRAPASKGFLFDQEHVTRNSDSIFRLFGILNRTSVINGSFFESIPENMDLYILKNVLHDWDDENCVRILKRISAVMKPGARLLIIESVIGPDNRPSIAKYIDLQMLIGTAGGRERTLEEYKRLLAGSDLRLCRLIRNATDFSLLEVART